MSAFKQLYKSDITVTPYTANKLWSFSYTSIPNDGYITYYIGTNTPFSISGSTTTNGEYQSSIYAVANQLYYQSYTSSLNTQSLAVSIYYESASSQRPTSSYYKYQEGNTIKNFPSGAGDRIGLLGVSSDLYGNNILPYSIKISSSLVTIIDDGNGNLYDVTYLPTLYVDSLYVNPYYAISTGYISSSYLTSSYLTENGSDFTPIHIGNIFYGQGMFVITNNDYINFLSSPITLTKVEFQNNYNIYETEVRCIVKETVVEVITAPDINLKPSALPDKLLVILAEEILLLAILALNNLVPAISLEGSVGVI